MLEKIPVIFHIGPETLVGTPSLADLKVLKNGFSTRRADFEEANSKRNEEN